MQKLVFYGLYGSFSIEKVGGIESIIRRLANVHISNGGKVVLIYYGSKKYNITEEKDGEIKIINTVSFVDALKELNSYKKSIIINIYSTPIQRIRHHFFKKKYNYFIILSSFPESLIKQLLIKLQTRFIKKKVKYITLSKRINSRLVFKNTKSFFLPPPIMDDFFAKKNEINKPIKIIAFMGRLDFGKGADIAYDVFNHLSKNSVLKFNFYSYYWKNDEWAQILSKKIKKHPRMNLIEESVDNYSKDIDVKLANCIDSTDLFFLPYRFLMSTIDTPLVPLEILSRNGRIYTTDFEPFDDLKPLGCNVFPTKKLNNINFLSQTILEILNRPIKDNNLTAYKASNVYSILLKNV
jgi:glycosyltransferase involved in cell wall biosynthesis